MSNDKIPVIVYIDLEELIPGFMKNRKADVEILRGAINGGDIEKVQSTGHSLKGVGGGYGFDRLSELGADIENAAKAGDADKIRSLIDDMADYLTRVEVTYE